MKKIAVASEGQMVTTHFGECQNFNIYETEDKQIVKSESLVNPGHRPGFLPKFLHEMGVNVVIAGGMGERAIGLFDQNGIEVFLGASGEAKAAAEAYLQGTLKSLNSVCHQHRHGCNH